ncbi:MAG TPA: ATP-binding protein [Nevskiaceae bacterium]|nr:ATP-binding protein [Nevskiaceae bacterium]
MTPTWLALLCGLLALLSLLLGLLCWRLWRRAAGPVPALPAQTEASARREAAEAERQRIFQDLHDDVGAKLLTLIHRLEDPLQADLARAVLQDLRDVVSRTRDVSGSLLEVLAQIRDETEQRLDLARVALDWQQPRELPDPPLDQAQALHLFRILREAVSNALRHAQPQHLRIRARVVAGELMLDVTDDGPGVEGLRSGQGTRGMQARAEQLHGSIAWDPGTTGGTKVVLRFPLPASTR